jgi:hypothetical protein
MTEPSSTFLCPITHELMVDPVIDPDGNSNAERSKIGLNRIKRRPSLVLLFHRLIFVPIVHFKQRSRNIDSHFEPRSQYLRQLCPQEGVT